MDFAILKIPHTGLEVKIKCGLDKVLCFGLGEDCLTAVSKASSNREHEMSRTQVFFVWLFIRLWCFGFSACLFRYLFCFVGFYVFGVFFVILFCFVLFGVYVYVVVVLLV